MKNLGLYIIIDPNNIGNSDLYNLAKDIIQAGADTIQLRNKISSDKEVIDQAYLIKKLCNLNNTTFIINDRVEVAMETNPDGIHLGRDDMDINKCRDIFGDKFIIGNSNATTKEAMESSKLNLNYIAIGSLFETITKKDTIPSSINVIKDLKNSKFKLPVVGIGGINKERAASVLEAGADSICISSAVTLAQNPIKEVKDLKNIMKKYGK
ncbi:MAG: thiamine phosphate synthase [Chloroflexota bacterium]|nr:thiamine phosphate synthase [Chloroflexota bacterium]|tara:strand:- start:490 stop:1119 length:630 start_codon:yes stop_codon:yes gene_type:complete